MIEAIKLQSKETRAAAPMGATDSSVSLDLTLKLIYLEQMILGLHLEIIATLLL